MKGFYKLRLKAGMLPLVLAVSMVMASLCSIMLMLAYYHMHYSKSLAINTKLQRNITSAIQIGLATPEQLPLNEWVWLDLYEEGVDSVGVQRSLWGVYELLQVKAVQGTHHLSKSVILGNAPEVNEPALYVADQDRSIKLAGNALIRGDAYLPKAGIKAGYIDRYGYNKPELVSGKSFRSEPVLPIDTKVYLASLKSLFAETGAMPIDSLTQELVVSFNVADKALFHSTSPIRLGNGQVLVGKMVVRSDKQITVSPTARLDGLILLAPKIVFEQGFQGTVQAFATDTLLIEEKVFLSYPSAVGVLQKKGGALLTVKPEASVEGVVFLLAKEKYDNMDLIWLQENTKVLGQVYGQGTVQHEGSIDGSLYAQKLYIKTHSSREEDYLYNGQINRERLPREYVGSAMLCGKGKRKIISWVE